MTKRVRHFLSEESFFSDIAKIYSLVASGDCVPTANGLIYEIEIDSDESDEDDTCAERPIEDSMIDFNSKSKERPVEDSRVAFEGGPRKSTGASRSDTENCADDLSERDIMIYENDPREIKFFSNDPRKDIAVGDDRLIKVILPKRSAIYATVKVNRNGFGVIPKLHLKNGIFTADSLVNAVDGQAKIAFINSLEKDFVVDIPTLELEDIEETIVDFEDFDGEKVSVFNLMVNDRTDLLKEKIAINHLNDEEKKSFNEIIEEFSDVFYLEGDQLNSNKIFEHEIILKEKSKPIRQYKTPFNLRGELDKSIKKMVEADMV